MQCGHLPFAPLYSRRKVQTVRSKLQTARTRTPTAYLVEHVQVVPATKQECLLIPLQYYENSAIYDM